MNFPRNLLLLCAAVLAASSSALAQEAFMLEPVLLPKNAPVPAATRQLLQAQGSQVVTNVDGVRTVPCQLWWAKAVSAPDKSVKANDVLYGDLVPGAMLGLLYFPTENEDSRDQKLKPGYYIMRYAQIPPPAAPDHESSPYRDFAALVPLNSDPGTADPLPEAKLMELSRRASHTSTPALLDLMQVNPAYKNLPAIINDDTGRCVMQVKLNSTRSGKTEIPLAILLITPPKENGGS